MAKYKAGNTHNVYGQRILVLRHEGKGYYRVRHVGNYSFGYTFRGKWCIVTPGKEATMHGASFGWGSITKPTIKSILKSMRLT